MTKRSQDPEFIKKRDKAAAKTIRKNHQDGVFRKAQKLLYEKLNSSFPGYFGYELGVTINDSIRSQYNCDHRRFILDIPFIVDGVTLHNFEIDGRMGHSTDEERKKTFLEMKYV